METEVPETAFRHDLANFLEELLLKIFSYLRIDDLCRAGGTCSRWYRLTRPLWKIVDCRHLELTSERIARLFSILPCDTKHLRICSFPNEHQLPNFRWLKLRCPELETLHLRRVHMADGVTIWDLPLKITVLSFLECKVIVRAFFNECDQTAQIKVLSFTNCLQFSDSYLSRFSQHAVPFLQELYLSGCLIDDEWLSRMASAISQVKVLDLEETLVDGSALEKLSRSCTFLEELFLANTLLTDEKLETIQAPGFPNLRVICLKGIDISLECQRSLIFALPSLQYVNGFPREDVLENDIAIDVIETCYHFSMRYKGFD